VQRSLASAQAHGLRLIPRGFAARLNTLPVQRVASAEIGLTATPNLGLLISSIYPRRKQSAPLFSLLSGVARDTTPLLKAAAGTDLQIRPAILESRVQPQPAMGYPSA